MHHRTFLQAFSEKIIWISSQDAYTEKIYKIQKFIGQDITYKHDLNYFSKNGSYMTDYQLPWSLTLILKSGDCNNKTWLFVELCRVNGILSAIAFVPGHTFPLVGYKSKDLEKGHIRPVYTSGDYAYIPIESTSSDWPIGEINDQHIPYMRSENIYPFRPL